MVTKLCGLFAVAAGALLMMAPAHAQMTWAEWAACMDLWADESICGAEPAPEPPPPEPEPVPPPPEPEPEPVPPPPPPPEPEPEPVPPPPPPPPPEPVPPPPPPPEPEPESAPPPETCSLGIPNTASARGKQHGQRGIDRACQAHDDHRHSHHSRGHDRWWDLAWGGHHDHGRHGKKGGASSKHRH